MVFIANDKNVAQRKWVKTHPTHLGFAYNTIEHKTQFQNMLCHNYWKWLYRMWILSGFLNQSFYGDHIAYQPHKACSKLSLPLPPSSSLLPLVYEAILPKHGCYIKQLHTFQCKCTQYFYILLPLTWEDVLHAPTVQIWTQNSTIVPPKRLLIGSHYKLVTENSSKIEGKFFLYPVVTQAY